MSRKKVIVFLTVIGLIIIILIPTTYLIVKNHNNKLRDVTYKRITEAAKKCHLKEECKEDKITLKELYDKKYLEKERNPITKEYYNEESYVKVDGKEYKFVEVK